MLTNLLKPVTTRAGRELVTRLFDADGATFREALERTRSRTGAAAGAAEAKGAIDTTTTPGGGGGREP